jgi:hypothetical protein
MQFLVETDVLTEYLVAPAGEMTTLRKALAQGVCYTTMINALELFRAAATKEESDAVMRMLLIVRVLGFNSRYAETFAGMAQEIERKTTLHLSEREILIMGMARVSKLSILTTVFFDRYTGFKAAPVQRSIEEVPIGE